MTHTIKLVSFQLWEPKSKRPVTHVLKYLSKYSCVLPHCLSVPSFSESTHYRTVWLASRPHQACYFCETCHQTPTHQVQQHRIRNRILSLVSPSFSHLFSLLRCHVFHMTAILTYSMHVQIHEWPAVRQWMNVSYRHDTAVTTRGQWSLSAGLFLSLVRQWVHRHIVQRQVTWWQQNLAQIRVEGESLPSIIPQWLRLQGKKRILNAKFLIPSPHCVDLETR